MFATLKIGDRLINVDLSKPLDISIPLKASSKNPIAWNMDQPTIAPVKSGDWIAKVSEGASVNFNTIEFNPHAHGTHTECIGHITPEFHSINETLKNFFFFAEVISVIPETDGEDCVISESQLKLLLKDKNPEALIIRSYPNTASKRTKKYTNTNWPYLQEKAAIYLRKLGVQHLLVDMPSVDKEKDGGKLVAHKGFWNYPRSPRLEATITEFVYVSNRIKDGSYLLNLQIASFHNDAAPSKPILYKFK